MKIPDKVSNFTTKVQNIKVEIGDHARPRSSLLGRKRIHISQLLKNGVQLIGGGLLIAVAVVLFIEPHNIAPGGATGLAIIINSLINIPFGLGFLLLLLNVPFFILGYKRLGGTSFLLRSLTATLTYSVGIEIIAPFFPANGLTDVMILNAIFSGLVGGLGAGLIYRAGGTAGAGGVINRLLRQVFGWPVKFGQLFSNSFVMGLAGIVFGWEAAMYAVISFFVSGSTADFVLEGPDVVQTALVITDKPQRVAHSLRDELKRGATSWQVENPQSGKVQTALYCTVTRPEINILKNEVAWADKDAFVIIVPGHEALGRGFRSVQWQPPSMQKIGNEAE
jgi:uncharacterized membrane-anchored protein YitT (DUF2179 family)